jgi:hypothetical protein
MNGMVLASHELNGASIYVLAIMNIETVWNFEFISDVLWLKCALAENMYRH